MDTVKFGIINVSDRAFKGIYDDVPGLAAKELIERYLKNPLICVYKVLPDEQGLIEQELRRMIDEEACAFVLTTGGTGPALRDVTPEATVAVCDKLLPGFGESMRARSLEIVPTAILSRQVAGIRGQSIIINLPGKPRAIEECLEVVFPAVPYGIELLSGVYLEPNDEEIACFRPA